MINDTCSPNNLNNDFSCFSKDDLLELTKSLNNYSDINLPITDSRAELWSNLYKQLKPKCSSEMCWLKLDFFSTLNPDLQKKLQLFTFKPKIGGPYKWLSTLDINNIMQQYQIIYPEMNYLGALPCDFVNYTKLPEISNTIKFPTVFILNLDSNKGSGSHWVGVYVNNNCIEYFDSLGKRPNKCIYRTFDKLFPEFDIVYNKIVHQLRNSQCGVYSIYFILQRLLGKSFKDISNNVIRDKSMLKFRRYLFNLN